MMGFIILILITLLLHLSHEYDMDIITRSPTVDDELATPSPDEITSRVLEFEGRRSSTLSPTEARLSLGDVFDLCEAIHDEAYSSKAVHSIKSFYFVPVRQTYGYGAPIFTNPCYGWIRKKCSGRAKPPFDYRCHFWVPFYVFAGPECSPKKNQVAYDRRKKRVANFFDSVTVSGLEAVTLCATAANIKPVRVFLLSSVALPTNEASPLRCVNWKLSPEGGWHKETLPKLACDATNAKRPAPYITDEILPGRGAFADLFDNIVRCEARGTVVDCRFTKDNMREPVLN